MNRILTIGHSAHSMLDFLDLLHMHKTQVLVDIRSIPWSSRSPQFNRDGGFIATLVASGITYMYMGDTLGGRPGDRKHYNDAGYVSYASISETLSFKRDIDRLCKGVNGYRIVLMCSEKSPAYCHRRLLVSRVLLSRGVSVAHIMGLKNGLLCQENVGARGGGDSFHPDSFALDVFPPADTWMSVHPVRG